MIQQMIQNMLGDYSKLITLLPNGQIRLNIIKNILQLTNLKISNMITEYKVIKPFRCAEVDDVFSYNKENENFIMSSEKTTDNTYSAKSMVISAKVIDNYTKAGLLSPTKEDKIDNNSDKVNEAGKMPTCQKVEHDTVYFNLMKVLNKFESIINE